MSTAVLGVIDRDRGSDPSSGLGLFLHEAHSLLKALQAVVLGRQIDELMRGARRCRGCGKHLVRKDTKFLIYRTAFGKARIPSPRLYSRCANCGTMADSAATFSALARALPERVHPQWKWLQCRYASVMSFKLARTFLRDAFPGGTTLPCSSVKATVRATGNRLEAEARQAIMDTADEVRRKSGVTGACAGCFADRRRLHPVDSSRGWDSMVHRDCIEAWSSRDNVDPRPCLRHGGIRSDPRGCASRLSFVRLGSGTMSR